MGYRGAPTNYFVAMLFRMGNLIKLSLILFRFEGLASRSWGCFGEVLDQRV